MQVMAYYDFYTDNIRPLQLIVRPKQGSFDWSKTFYIRIMAPIARAEPEDFGDLTGVSVLIEDLIRSQSDERLLGISLPRIYDRHQQEFDQLIIQMDDVEEVLQYTIDWR